MKSPLFSLALVLGLAGCATANPTPDTSQPHHRAGGTFQNNYVDFEPKGVLRLLQWKAQAAAAGLPKPPLNPTAVVRPDLGFIQANARAGVAMQPAVTWIGHATALVQAGGANILTDPIFSERASPLDYLGPKRAQPPGLSLAELPRIDAVVISHNHYDHLDLASVKALAAQAGGPPLFVVPLGNKRWFVEAAGITNVVELDWWKSTRLAGPAGVVEIFLTPVQHWSGRSLTDRLESLWGGYAVFTPGFSWFYAGDTGYSKDFADIQRRFAPRLGPEGGFDLALIPIGSYEPRWFMATQHVNPEEAVLIHLDVRARQSIAVHWGTFELTDESLDEPPRALTEALNKKALNADQFAVLAIGQTHRFGAAQRRTAALTPTPSTAAAP